MRVLVSWEEYVATKEIEWNVATFMFPKMEIEKSGKFQVVVDLNTDEDAPAGTIVTFDGSFDDSVFDWAKYTDSNKSDVEADEISWVISFATKLTVQAWKASFTNSLTKAVEFKDNDVATKTVFDGTYTAKKSDVNLTDFMVETALDEIPEGVTATFYLYIDWKEVADARLRWTTLSASDSISKVSVKAGESVKVRIDAEVSAKKVLDSANADIDDDDDKVSSLELGKFAITLNGEDDNNNPITTTPKNTVLLKVVTAGSLKIGDASAARAKDVLVRWTEAKLAQFTVKPSNWASDVEFDSFTFAGTYGDDDDYVAEDLVVTLGNNTELECYDDNGAITCDANETLSAEWATITIALNDSEKATWTVTIDVAALNGTELTSHKTFEKRFLDAVVRVEKQEFKKATTVFTLSVELADDVDEDPVGLTLYACAADSVTPSDEVVYENATLQLEDGKTITITNGSTAALVCWVEYGNEDPITKLNEEDYFKKIPTTYVDGKTSSDDLMVANVD